MHHGLPRVRAGKPVANDGCQSNGLTTPKSATRSKSRTLRVASVEGEPGELTTLFEPAKALWAFPLAGGAFAGMRKLVGAIQGEIQLEAGDGAPELRTEVAQLFASAGVEARTPPDFRAWLWLHYVSSRRQ